MDVRSTITILALATACGCGEPFTYASGSGGAGGAGTSSASSASSATSSGTGGTTQPTCALGVAGMGCPSGQYCATLQCGNGTCEAIPTAVDPMPKPVCGCNGSTYINDAAAASHGVPIAGQGACASLKPCTNNSQCAQSEDEFCDLDLGGGTECGGGPSGACVGLPHDCNKAPAIAATCDAPNKCISICDAIHQGVPWKLGCQ